MVLRSCCPLWQLAEINALICYFLNDTNYLVQGASLVYLVIILVSTFIFHKQAGESFAYYKATKKSSADDCWVCCGASALNTNCRIPFSFLADPLSGCGHREADLRVWWASPFDDEILVLAARVRCVLIGRVV
jgi:hypothetical protein